MRLEPPPPPPRPDGTRPRPRPFAARLRSPRPTPRRDGLTQLAYLHPGQRVLHGGRRRESRRPPRLSAVEWPGHSGHAATGGVIGSSRRLAVVKEGPASCIEVLTETAEAITAQGLDQRTPRRHGRGRRVRAPHQALFNAMLGRLEQQLSPGHPLQRRRGARVKTPLDGPPGELEQAVQEAEVGSRQQQVFGELLAQVQRLKTIVRKLLLLSLADAGRWISTRRAARPERRGRDAPRGHGGARPGLTATARVDPQVWVQAEPELLGQVLQNLAATRSSTTGPGARSASSCGRGPVRPSLGHQFRAGRFPRGRGAGLRPVRPRQLGRDRAVDGVGLG